MNFREVTNIIANVITFILCTFGNSLVIISLKKFEWLRMATNYFLALLAFYDFCSGLPVFTVGRIEGMDLPSSGDLALTRRLAGDPPQTKDHLP